MKRIVQALQLAYGDKGVDETVQHVRRLARRDAKDPRVLAIVRRFPTDRSAAAVKAAFLYVVRGVRYQYDPTDIEEITAPIHTLTGARPYGDCEDMTGAICCLLVAMGIKCWAKVIAHRPDAPQQFTHIYAMAEIKPGGPVIPLDAVMGNLGFGNEKFPVNRHKEYLI